MRRASKRVCVHSDVGILDEQDGARTLGQLRDLSSTGASIAAASSLAVGRLLRLAFEFEPGEPPVRLRGEVVWTGRAATTRDTVLSGVRFTELDGADFARLRDFIDRKLFEVQSFLSRVELFADLTDLEKLLLASVVLDRKIAAGAMLDDSLCTGSLAIVRVGTLECSETLGDGRTSGRRTVGAGDLFGGMPIDPCGATRIVAKALCNAGVMVITPDGFQYLIDTHLPVALKLASAWALAMRDRLLAVEPLNP